jgi:hypothetical protein
MFNAPPNVQSVVSSAGEAVKSGVQATEKVGKRAANFIAAIGTSGGPVGSAALIGFGAGAVTGALATAYQREQGLHRMAGEAIEIGSPHSQSVVMPPDLQAGYLNLNTFGSPLPTHGLMGAHNLRASQRIQDQATASAQQYISAYMPQTGQLPFGEVTQQPQQKGRR